MVPGLGPCSHNRNLCHKAVEPLIQIRNSIPPGTRTSQHLDRRCHFQKRTSVGFLSRWWTVMDKSILPHMTQVRRSIRRRNSDRVGSPQVLLFFHWTRSSFPRDTAALERPAHNTTLFHKAFLGGRPSLGIGIQLRICTLENLSKRLCSRRSCNSSNQIW
jgi:hypothetical protein